MIWRWVGRVAAAILGLAVVVAVGGYLWLRTSLPQTEGRVAVAGLSAPASILRDENGVVTIRAGSAADGYLALGYAHAQDRLFQMEFMRRLGAGRLSEVIGPATLELDKRMRVFGLYARAAESLAELAPEVQLAIDAYAAGVNAYLQGHRGALPPEFLFLRHDPEPWMPADSLVWGRLMALQLSSNWREELFRLRLSRQLPRARLEELWPAASGPGDGAALAPPRDIDLAALPPSFESVPGASNSWVVAGNRTTSGKPILANDPHLGLVLPSQWYLARVETPEGTVAGATAPGVPFAVIGHNGRVAWSFTTTGADTQDLFVERLVPGATDRYVTPGGPSLFDSHVTTIGVRGAAPVELAVRQTTHGPVISDIGLAAEAAGDGEVVALAWTGLRADDRTAEALYRMNRAADAAEFRDALRLFDSPQQTIVYADVAGATGFVAAGRVPVRKSAVAAGQMPAPGWTGTHDWIGTIPFEALPQSVDPASGEIVTANNDITPPGYPHFIAARFDVPFRAARIAELLAGRGDITLDATAAMQMDDLSPVARDILPVLLGDLELAPLQGRAAAAAGILRGWDYRMGRDQAAPLIFTAWMQELDRALFGAELGPLYDDFARWNGNGAGALLSGFSAPQRDWCPPAQRLAEPACREVLAPALEAAVAGLARVYGEDPSAWRWGDAHQARFAHPLLDRLPVLGGLTATAVETDGDNFTVNRGTALSGPDFSFTHVHGASLRAVFDLADLDSSLFMLPGGQSGNFLSPHFTDLVLPWRDGRFLTIVGGAGRGLTLEPAGP